MIIRSYIFIALLFFTSLAQGQDPQFSQYYNAPLLINPAFAGATECYRVGTNSRIQWTGLEGTFKTATLYADLNVPDLRSGFGIMVLHDNIGVSRLSSNEISGFYSFLAPVSEQFNLRFGLQGTYASRHINYSRLIFEDQFSGTSLTGPASSDPVTAHNTTQYFDVSSGILLYGEDTYWLGFSAHHLNRPDQAFYSAGLSRLPVRYSLHGGFNIYYRTHIMQEKDDMLRIIPTFIYKAESRFDQLDLGAYVIKSYILLGAWYRGVFPKTHDGIRNNDALILQAGVRLNSFSFTYSYDITTSRLGISNTLGSHEISLIYIFCLDWPPRKKPGRKVRRLPCPDFQRR